MTPEAGQRGAKGHVGEPVGETRQMTLEVRERSDGQG